MKKNIKRIILFLIMFTLFTFCLQNFILAVSDDPTAIIEEPKQEGVTTLYTLGNNILGIIQIIGAGVAVVAALVLGIKYMYTAPGEQAEIKKKAIPYIIGGMLTFGAIQLVKIVETFTNEII